MLRGSLLSIALIVAAASCSNSDTDPAGASTTPTSVGAEPAADTTDDSTAGTPESTDDEPTTDEPAGDAATDGEAVDEPADAASDTAAPDSEPAATDDTVTEADLERFIAATESAIAGTSAEGAVLEAPEIYIAIAQSACARFTDGDDFETIAADLLADIAAGDPTGDDERLVGGILGAATHTLCPEHADKI